MFSFENWLSFKLYNIHKTWIVFTENVCILYKDNLDSSLFVLLFLLFIILF